MPKYYINSGTLQLIYSTPKTAIEAACVAIFEINEDDELGREIFVDERGMRDKTTADEQTMIFDTDFILEEADWENNS